jgi:PAS domain S-box-containing protein
MLSGSKVHDPGREVEMDEDLIARAIVWGPEAIVAADRDGVIRFWNAGAERIFGFTSAQAVGRSLDLIIPERLRARHWAGWRQVMATGQSRYGAADVLAVPGMRQDGTPVSVEFMLQPVRDAAGQVLGLAATIRDVTERFTELRELRRQVAGTTSPG